MCCCAAAGEERCNQIIYSSESPDKLRYHLHSLRSYAIDPTAEKNRQLPNRPRNELKAVLLKRDREDLAQWDRLIASELKRAPRNSNVTASMQ
jgi:hypothetical protein